MSAVLQIYEKKSKEYPFNNIRGGDRLYKRLFRRGRRYACRAVPAKSFKEADEGFARYGYSGYIAGQYRQRGRLYLCA